MTMILLPLLALAAAGAPTPNSPPVARISPFGIWQNPHKSIAVRIAPCGQQICGQIVMASDEAQQDARDSGVQQLIGTQLLSDYRQVASRRWDGTVFVPDMGRHFSSHIVQLEPNVLRISGCLIGGMLCKSQDWTRR